MLHALVTSMKTTTHTPLDDINVNFKTGAISYPSPEGFVLDIGRMYRSAERFGRFCPSAEMAVKHAIHEQISAYSGIRALLAGF